MVNSQVRSAARFIAIVLSVAVGPWVVFVSTANTLYLLNQADLDYNLGHYQWFLQAFALTWFVGIAIAALAHWRPRLGPLLWFYQLLGFACFVFIATLANNYLEKYQNLWIASLLVMLAALLFLVRKKSPARTMSFMAILAVLLMGADGYRFATTYRSDVPDRLEPIEKVNEHAGAATQRMPNVYHVLLDGFQSDMLPAALAEDPQLRGQLGGFVEFPENLTPYGRTVQSIPATFGSRIWDPNQDFDVYTAEAMTGPTSLLYRLQRAGYSTTAYLHSRYRFEPNLFEKVHFHHNAARNVRDLDSEALRALWVYRFLPRAASERLLDEETRTQIFHSAMSPSWYAITSHDTYLGFLSREPELGDSNRYTFLHFLLPHHPYVVNCQCEFEYPVEPIEQFCCGINMVARLCKLLKDLGRFEESLIVVHGDHGLNFEVGDSIQEVPLDLAGEAWNSPRTRTLLAIKPPGVGDAQPLRQIAGRSSLLDLAPTMARLLGLEPPEGALGYPLLPQPEFPKDRELYYHYLLGEFFEDGVYRFAYEGSDLRFDRFLRPDGYYDKLPVATAGQVWEAENCYVKKTKKSALRSNATSSGEYLTGGGVSLKVRVPESGSYRLRLRVCLDDETPGTLVASANERDYERWEIEPCEDWEWQVAPFTWHLTAGEHVLTIMQGKTGLLDQLVLERI